MEDYADGVPFIHRSEVPWLRAQAAAIARTADLLGEAFHTGDKKFVTGMRRFAAAAVAATVGIVAFGADVAQLTEGAVHAYESLHERLSDVHGELLSNDDTMHAWANVSPTDVRPPGGGDTMQATGQVFPPQVRQTGLEANKESDFDWLMGDGQYEAALTQAEMEVAEMRGAVAAMNPDASPYREMLGGLAHTLQNLARAMSPSVAPRSLS